ncbi:pre-mRNA-splicing factor RBM22-like protein [Lates japonicus]|uniref:Pre-mRNA-splicing factor RBM22-like protein n=1 Tax=Lates japonicus TaxID=270547 RepID=A0AAD3N7E7_LATJO|nr:pre-mRNA-splicing factor RBM22-like protein [Lates japonicus]
MDHCRLTELQKERGILRFPDFSQSSPLCRFHITADSKPETTTTTTCAQRASIPHSTRPLRVVPDSPRLRRRTAPPLGLPGQASERCLAQTENEASFFGLTLSLPSFVAGNIKPRRYSGGSVQLSARLYGSGEGRLTLLLKRVMSKFVLEEEGETEPRPAALLCGLISEFLYPARIP